MGGGERREGGGEGGGTEGEGGREGGRGEEEREGGGIKLEIRWIEGIFHPMIIINN